MDLSVSLCFDRLLVCPQSSLDQHPKEGQQVLEVQWPYRTDTMPGKGLRCACSVLEPAACLGWYFFIFFLMTNTYGQRKNSLGRCHRRICISQKQAELQ